MTPEHASVWTLVLMAAGLSVTVIGSVVGAAWVVGAKAMGRFDKQDETLAILTKIVEKHEAWHLEYSPFVEALALEKRARVIAEELFEEMKEQEKVLPIHKRADQA